jgi:Zn-dependent peptidase ImmA (M78 family)
VSDWVDNEFTLPDVDFPVLNQGDPEQAAVNLRQAWLLGERPVSNMIKLLESKGIRVFSLSEATKNVDAYSFWRDDVPFVFLNNYKTPEHSIFDCAHELGHLFIHRHQGPKHERGAEYEANKFASAFLMPRNDVLAHMPRFVTVNDIIAKKGRWRVSAMALAYRLRDIEVLSDWQYRSACIELSHRGYRSDEPIGVERETSVLWKRVLHDLWADRLTKDDIANAVGIPFDELESLLFGIIHPQVSEVVVNGPSGLRLVT